MFSFNSPLGACTNCQGYGRIIGIDMEKVLPNRDLRLSEKPVTPWNSAGYEDCYEDLERAAASQPGSFARDLSRSCRGRCRPDRDRLVRQRRSGARPRERAGSDLVRVRGSLHERVG